MKRLDVGFLKNLAILTVGTIVGQLVGVLSSPLLTRIYDPHAFGRFGVFSAVVGTIGSAACFKYEQAVMNERSERRAMEVMGLCGLVTVLVALLIPAVLAISDAPVTRWLGDDVTAMLMIYGTVSVIAAGLYNVLNFWGIRKRAYNALAGYQVLRSSTVLACQAVLGLAAAGAGGLILGQLIGQVVGVLLLLVAFRMDLWSCLLRSSRLGRLWRLARKHRDFALYSAPQSVLNSLSSNIPTLLLAALFSPVESGLFWLAFRILMLPSLILVESLRSVLYQRLSEIHNRGESMRALVRRSAWQLAALCLPVVIVLALIGPDLFGFVFGATWRGAGVAAAILAPSWLIQNAAVPAAVAGNLIGKQRAYFLLEIPTTALRAGAIVAGAAMGSVTLALAFYSAVGALAAIIVMIIVHRSMILADQARAGARDLHRDIAPEATALVVSAGANT